MCGDLVCSDSWCVAGVCMCMYVGLCGRPRRGGGAIGASFLGARRVFQRAACCVLLTNPVCSSRRTTLTAMIASLVGLLLIVLLYDDFISFLECCQPLITRLHLRVQIR